MMGDIKFHHGGQLDQVKQDHPDQLLPWIDLSTGVSPFSYPIDAGVQECFKCLPQGHQTLMAAASRYYGVDNALPIPGSMWAIQKLPLLRKIMDVNASDHRPVLLPRVGFNEHVKAWAAWGFNIEYYNNMPSTEQINGAQACVVINPNNPTGAHNEKQVLLNAHELLSRNNAWLIIDEAFMDMTPEHSCVAESWRQGLIILRSFGKYFGLPGIRLGSLMASDDITDVVRRLLNEWSINSAAQQIAETAFLDETWQEQASTNIRTCSVRLKALLVSHGLKVQGTDYFQTHTSSDSEFIYEYLLSLGIYVRLLDDKSGIRIGLPGEEEHWSRLDHAFKNCIQLNNKSLNAQLKLN